MKDKIPKSLLLLFCLIFILTVNGQNSSPTKTFNFFKYQKFINEAEYSFSVEKDYKKTLAAYDSAMLYVSATSPDAFYLIRKGICYLNLNDTTKAVNSIVNAVSKGYLIVNEMGWLKKMFQPSDWKEIMLKYPEAKRKYYSTLEDFELYIKLKNLEDRDQYIRHFSQIGALAQDQLDKLLKITDSLNFIEITTLINENKMNHLGISQGIAIELFHIYDENTKYFPFFDSILKVEVFNGSFNPRAYVQWFDRQRTYVNKMKTQVYGEWNDMGSGEITPIEDIENVDKRRAEFGLCTLEDYAKIYHLKLPPNYLPKKK